MNVLDIKPYSAYKPSGIEWLGEVPSHWELGRLARFGRLFKGRGGSKGDNVDEGVPCVRYGDLYTTHDGFIHNSRSFISKASATKYTPIEYGDVLFAASGETIEEIGASAVNLMTAEAYCAGDVIVFRPEVLSEARYLGYVAGCRPMSAQKASMGRGFTIVHIYGRQLRYLVVTMPPLREQQGIVRFLDYVDERIRGLVEVKEQLMTWLGELNTATISEAVTGRIDVRTGQPYSAYKPSGIEWLGPVPAHWEIRRLKTLCSQAGLYGANIPASQYAESGIRFIRITDITEQGELRSGGVFIDKELADGYVLAEGDLLVSRSGTVGRGFLYDPHKHGHCAYAGYLVRFRFAREVVGKWAYLFTKTLAFSEFLKVVAISSTIKNVNAEKYGNCFIPFPPPAEQSAIIKYLDRVTSGISAAISNTRREIELLNEYRTRMISDVVTGKVDAREATDRLEEPAA